MLNKLKIYLEKISITPTNWLVGISGIMMVRFFLESLSSPSSSGFFASDASTLVHYCVFFLTTAVVTMIFLELAIPSWKKVIPQLVAVSFGVILISPIVDWIISGGQGLRMAYLFDTPREMIFSWFSFFGKDLSVGITWGLRIEVGIILFTTGLLIYFLEKSWRRIVVSVIIFYSIIFIFLSLPGVINLIFGQNLATNYFGEPLSFIQKTIENSATLTNNLHGSLNYSSLVRVFEIAFNYLMGKIFFLILIVATLVWFCLNFKEKLLATIKNSRPERVTHYFLMIVLGLFVAHSMFPAIKFNWNDWLSVVVLFLSFYFSWLFAVCVNDLVDTEIDEVSNPNRPLIAKELTKEEMKQVATLALLASLISGFLAGYTSFFFVLAFTALYQIYSASPTRFKIIPFFSSFLISLCCLVATLAGFFLLSPVKYVHIFPAKLISAVIVIFFLGSHIRDLKDVEGDKKVGIKTVATIFGPTWGPKIVGFFAGAAFLLVPIFLGKYILLITAIPAALAVYYFANKKPYEEKFIFRIYFAFVLLSYFVGFY